MGVRGRDGELEEGQGGCRDAGFSVWGSGFRVLNPKPYRILRVLGSILLFGPHRNAYLDFKMVYVFRWNTSRHRDFRDDSRLLAWV